MSSAAIEYYGYLLSQGYGEDQINEFADYAKRANRGEISHNQAYRKALKSGFRNASGGSDGEATKGGFGDWMQTAKEAGWIDAGLGIIGAALNRGRNVPPPPPEPPKKNNTALYVGLAVVGVVGIGLTNYLMTRKK